MVSQPRVLHFEDDDAVARAFGDGAKHRGFAVQRCVHPTESIVADVLRLQPTCVVFDIVMPVMDGLSAAGTLRADARTARIPIAFFTSLGDTSTQARIHTLHAAYFSKLHNTVDDVLDWCKNVLDTSFSPS